MRFEIVHATRYRYSAPVFLEPHLLRFRPRSNSWQRLLDFDLRIDPWPAGISDTVDIEGNETLVSWFDGQTDHLALRARAVVETLRDNPFDFLWMGGRGLPMHYSAALEVPLQPYMQWASTPSLRQYAEESVKASEDAQSFLIELNRRLNEDCQYIVRPEGDPLPPEETLQRREGSCRDLAVLYTALCREFGFAARFVSGYCAAEGVEESELHAWTEVYVPGGGWRGFDPSMGLTVADRHIAVAAGAQSQYATPVAGNFRGSATSLPMETELTIRCLD